MAAARELIVVFVLTLPFRILAFALARSWGRRVVTIGALAASLAAGYQFWLRDASLLAIRQIEVSGLSGPDSQRVQSALAGAARGMTILNLDREALTAAVRPFPIIRSLEVDTSFPSGLEIRIVEHQPTALVSGAGRTVAVADDGTLLPGVATRGERLPVIEVDRVPNGRRLAGTALDQSLVLGAAPADLRPAIEAGGLTARGLAVYLVGGIRLDFGSRSSLAAKWAAATRILADESLRSLTYIDLRAPRRPSVGGASGAGDGAALEASTTAEAGSTAASPGVVSSPEPVAAETPPTAPPAAPSGGIAP